MLIREDDGRQNDFFQGNVSILIQNLSRFSSLPSNKIINADIPFRSR